MSFDQQHPGENNLPHSPLPELEPPHSRWEGPLEGRNSMSWMRAISVIGCVKTSKLEMLSSAQTVSAAALASLSRGTGLLR